MATYEPHRAVLYGPSAFQALGVALPEALQDWDNCHILVPSGGYLPIRRGVVAHQTKLPPTVWRTIGGLPLLHPVDHWLQLRRASIDHLVEVGDGLLRRQSPLLTLDAIWARLSQLDGVPGIKPARRAARWLVPGTDSLYETRTRLVLIHGGLPVPAVNCAVYCGSAGRWYHVDLGYDMEKVAVEYDGLVHVGNRVQMEIDARRRRELQDEGWLIITVTAEQLRRPLEIVRSVETALILRRSAGHALGEGLSMSRPA